MIIGFGLDRKFQFFLTLSYEIQFHVIGSSLIWTGRILKFFSIFLTAPVCRNNNKYSKFITSKLMSYQGPRVFYPRQSITVHEFFPFLISKSTCICFWHYSAAWIFTSLKKFSTLYLHVIFIPQFNFWLISEQKNLNQS